MARGGERTLAPVYPSAAIQASYQAALDKLIDAMSKDATSDLLAGYRENAPRALLLYGQDASPARNMQARVSKLERKWQRKFDKAADPIAQRFADAALTRVDRSIKASARKAGMGVRFKMSPAMNDAFQAIRAENVSLIKSIPSQYFTQVETMVTQSVAAGRDLAVLAKGLEHQFGVTKRRAATIARDQNNRATAVMARTRYLEMGIKRATWLHSAGGKVPRERHVSFSGKSYDIATGHDFDDGEGFALPGQLINCRCVAKPIIPGFDD